MSRSSYIVISAFRVSACVGLFVFLSGIAVGQASGVNCSLTPGAPAIRADGESELAGDLVVNCTGGTPTTEGQQVLPLTITVTLNVNVTSRLLAQGFSEALLLVDEPTPQTQLMCGTDTGVCPITSTGISQQTYNGTQGHPNVFQGKPGNANNQLQWVVPFDPPGSGIRILRITNVKVNALNGPNAITMAFFASGQVPINFVSPTQATVASAQSGVGLTTKNVQGGANGLTQFTLTYTEKFASAFKTRTAAPFVDVNTSPAPANQNTPGTTFPGSETGFFNASFPNIPARGNLGVAGLADSGTRLIARISNLPQGVTLSAPLSVNIIQATNLTGSIRLVNADANGAGPFAAAGAGQLPVANGIATAVYEVMRSDTNSIESVDIPITVSYTTAAAFPSATISGGFAALSGAVTADLTSAEPRFNNPIQASVSSSGPLTITTSSLPPATIGSGYSFTLTASGGIPPLAWSASGLPSGMSITSAGVLNGVPAANSGGTYTVTVTVTDSNKSSVGTRLPLTVFQPLVITTMSLSAGMVGLNYSQTLAAAGGAPPYRFALATPAFGSSPLPPGLSLSPNGTLSGVPTTLGSFPFNIVVTDTAQNQAAMNYTVAITPALVINTLSPLPPGAAGNNYSQTFAASGGTPPYTFSIFGNGPPGLTMSTAGVLSGSPTAAGTFAFNVQVQDSRQFVITKQFQVTIAAAAPSLQVSVVKLVFSAVTGGDAPAPQAVTILPTGRVPVNFTVQIDGGASNIAAPPWLTVRPLSGAAPGRLTVSVDPGTMPAGSYAAGIHVRVSPADATQNPIDISVSFTIAPAASQLEMTPTSLRFGARVQSPGAQEQVVFVRNIGGGALSFTASILGSSPWITSVTPGAGQTAPNSPIPLRVRVNTQGLDVGNYHGIIRITSVGGSIDVPVSLFVADHGAILGVNVTGLRFQARQGAGSSLTQVVNVLNLGDPGSNVSWSADLQSGADWLTILSPSGSASTNLPGALPLKPSPNAATFPAGARYALVRVSDSHALNSPQYVVAVLDIADNTTPPLPDPSPAGIFFSAQQGSQPVTQTVQVFTSSNAAVPFQVATATADGSAWLTAAPTTGTALTANSGQVSVTVNPALTPGIYSGTVNISMSGALRMVNITFVVTPAISSEPAGIRAAAGCTASKLAVTQTGMVNNFSIPAGWPATLIVQLNDDCGSPVQNGAVVASFSNGDPPLSLRGDQQTSAYSATWQPGIVLPQMTITIRATAGTFPQATAQFIGGVNSNPLSPPTLVSNGTLHIFFDVPTTNLLGGGLAPGTVAQVYGTGMASAAVSPGVVPLLTEFNGTFMLVGGFEAPLFYISDSLIDVQIPSELTPNRQYAAIVSANGALTLPQTVDIVPIQPGLALFRDGTGNVIAQRPADASLVDATHPAKPGEILTLYLAGMGATNPSVPSGNPAPSTEPLGRVTVQPTVTLDGQNVDISYAGLTPGGVGLYQINFTVSANARSGTLDLVVAQGTVTSNTTKLPVSR